MSVLVNKVDDDLARSVSSGMSKPGRGLEALELMVLEHTNAQVV